MNKKSKYLVILFLIIASLVVYGRILGNEFINFDDADYLTNNLHIKSGINAETVKWAFTAVVCATWHPLTLISHALDWSLFKDHAGGHHLISLLLHIGNAILLFLFLNKITKNLWPSAFVAALFVLHPLRVESVAWAAERKDVLSMFFGLASLYAYAYYVEKPQIAKYILCLILFVLALMSKSMLVTLPFLLLLLDFWPLERWQKALNPINLSIAGTGNQQMKKKVKKQKLLAESVTGESRSASPTISHLLLEKLPFFVFAVVSSILTIWAQNKGGAVASLQKLPFSERIMNALVSYVSYLGKTFWPVDLAVFYPYPHSFPGWQVLGAAAILIIISIAVIYFMKKAPFLFVGWFWYLGALVPVIGLVQVGRQAVADRYTYLPTMGIAIMVAWGLAYLLPREKISKFILIGATAFILMGLSFLTWRQCGYWKNSIELFNHALQVTDNNYLAHTNMGLALATEDKNNEAIDNCNAAIRINPNHDDAYYCLAVAFKDQENIEEAEKNYREAIKINTNHNYAHYGLANLLAKQGKIDEAINHYREAIKINVNLDIAHYNLANLLEKQGKSDEAINHYREAVRINPYHFDAHNNLGVNLVKRRQYDEAIMHYRQALQIKPNEAGLHLNLGAALADSGELKEAIEHFRTAVYLKPDYQDARRLLRLALEIEKRQKR